VKVNELVEEANEVIVNLPNLDFLSDFKQMVENKETELKQNQFQDFVSDFEIKMSKNLEKSYYSLISLLDDTTIELAKVYSHPFLFNLLDASVKKKEREMKKLVLAFCNFVVDAGTKNKPTHQIIRKNYANTLSKAVSELESQDRVADWITNLKERLDTKNNN
jgi:cobalamin biosynthesis Co2+ chelatase CbiK